MNNQEINIQQNIEILWYIFSFLPQGYGVLLKFVSKSFKEAVITNYEPIYTDLISMYGLKPNLIEQFRLSCTIDMYCHSKSKWLKLLRWSRKYYPDTDILLLYSSSINNTDIVKSICNISQLPPLNTSICLDYAYKNTNIVLIKKLYEYDEDLSIEHLLWLCIIHNNSEIAEWLCFVQNRTKASIDNEVRTMIIISLFPNNISQENINELALKYMNVVITTKEDFKRELLPYSIDKAKPFYYHF